MKRTILAMSLMMAATCQAETTGVIIIGDSIAAKADSWPTVLRDEYGYHVKGLVQGGRMLSHYQLPIDLLTVEHNTIVLSLGTNDGIAINGKTGWPRALMGQRFTERYNTLIDTATNKGFRVIINLPPVYHGYEDGMQYVRGIMAERCNHYWCIDLSARLDLSNTTDGIHPTYTMTKNIAAIVAGEL